MPHPSLTIITIIRPEESALFPILTQVEQSSTQHPKKHAIGLGALIFSCEFGQFGQQQPQEANTAERKRNDGKNKTYRRHCAALHSGFHKTDCKKIEN
jgi:hypothetical protein